MIVSKLDLAIRYVWHDQSLLKHDLPPLWKMLLKAQPYSVWNGGNVAAALEKAGLIKIQRHNGKEAHEVFIATWPTQRQVEEACLSPKRLAELEHQQATRFQNNWFDDNIMIPLGYFTLAASLIGLSIFAITSIFGM